jgi:hypothetical protein
MTWGCVRFLVQCGDVARDSLWVFVILWFVLQLFLVRILYHFGYLHTG